MATIPLCISLEEGAKTRRHCIPYLTYQRYLINCCSHSLPHEAGNCSLLSPQTEGALRCGEQKENHEAECTKKEQCFFHYLLSGETRFPNHPLLIRRPSPPEEYDTYVGEEELRKKKEKTEKGGASEEEGSSSDAPLPSFSEAVDWITNSLEFLSSLEADTYSFTRAFTHQKDGPPPPRSGRVESSSVTGISIPAYEQAGQYQVVLAGKYGIIDDCPWAVFSRSSKLDSTQDVMLMMLSSVKFSKDLERQQREIQEGKATTMEFSLIRAMGNGGADEWRVFIPYQILPMPSHSNTDNTLKAVKKKHPYAIPLLACSRDLNSSSTRFMLVPQLEFTAVSQRCTDVCYPDFETWNEEQHHEHHQLLVERVVKANLLGNWHRPHPRTEQGGGGSFPLHSGKADAILDKGQHHETPSPLEAALEECMKAIQSQKNTTWNTVKKEKDRPVMHPSGSALGSMKEDSSTGGEKVSMTTEEHQGVSPLPSPLLSPSAYPFSDAVLLEDTILVLAVDVLWSSSTLPVYVLSGKFHLFLRPKSEKNNLSIDWKRLEVEEVKKQQEEGGKKEEDDMAAIMIPFIWTSDSEKLIPEGKESEEETNEAKKGRSEETESEGSHPEIVPPSDLSTLPESESFGFWRLLRTAAHWNQYLQNVQNARKKASNEVQINQITGNSDEKKYIKKNCLRSFCVIATEGDDLFAEKKDECRSGVPLEFLHPELLADNPEFFAVFQKWKDQQVEEEAKKSSLFS